MWSMGMMPVWIMAMPHRMMKMKIAPVVVSCAAWPGEAVASESTRLTLNAGSPSSAEHDCMRLSNGVAWRARSGWGVEGGVVPNERPCNPRGPDSDGDAQALPPGIIGWQGHFVAIAASRSENPAWLGNDTFGFRPRAEDETEHEAKFGHIYFPWWISFVKRVSLI
jgi:hypothetical protein